MRRTAAGVVHRDDVGDVAAVPIVSQLRVQSGHGPARYVAPLNFAGDPDDVTRRLRAVIEQVPGATNAALHAEFASRILRFVDDVDLVLDAPQRVVHVRSASRVGDSDLGVNRRRHAALV